MIIYKPDNENKTWSIDTIEKNQEIPEGYTLVKPPKINYRLIFDWDKNEWVETATEYQKAGFESREDYEAEKAEQERLANLPTSEERLQAMEDSLLYLMMEEG